MPARSQTGTPPHFTVSTTSGTAWWIRSRTRARVRPRQSFNMAIFASIWRAGVSATSVMVGLLAGSHLLARKARGLPDPVNEAVLVEDIVLVDVEIADVLLLGPDRRERVQGRAAEE